MSEHNHDHTVTVGVESVRLDLAGDESAEDFGMACLDFVEALKKAIVRSLNTIETDECDTHEICAQFGLISLTGLTSAEIIENIDELLDAMPLSGIIEFGDDNILSFVDDHFTIT